MKCIFKHNISLFNQLRGTGIGAKIKLAYATIFIDELEEKVLKDCDQKYLLWRKYMDDIFALWQHREKIHMLRIIFHFHKTRITKNYFPKLSLLASKNKTKY